MREAVERLTFPCNMHRRIGMRMLCLLCFVTFFATAFANLKNSEATGENAVPVSMDIHYISVDGKSFRLFRDEGFVMENRVCMFKTVTRYVINHPFEEDAQEITLEVPVKDWILFRQALRAMNLEKMRRPTNASVEIKTSFWSVRIDYPDGTIAVEETDSPSEATDFAPLRQAIFALTKGKWPVKKSASE